MADATAPESPASAKTAEHTTPAGVNPVHYRVALQHANLIQARKNVESRVLASMEELMSLPSSSDASAASPSESDLGRFQNLIEPFQTSDYEDLFEERNLIEKCAYVFCPRTPLREPHRGPVRLVPTLGQGKGLTVAEAKNAERWCSEACARRALYIKVQLSETPAWERLGGPTKPIQILDKQHSNGLLGNQLEQRSAALATSSLEKLMAQLAIERGDSGAVIRAT